MINEEPTLARIFYSEAELIKEKARQSTFIDALEQELINVSLQLFPDAIQHKHQFIDGLRIKAHNCAVEVNEILDLTLVGMSSADNPIFSTFSIPPRDISVEEQQFLEKTLKSLPPEQHETFKKLNDERIQEESVDRTFQFLCYDKTKEMICRFFPEIINFTGNEIRNIDRISYFTMFEWKYNFYSEVDEYLNLPSK